MELSSPSPPSHTCPPALMRHRHLPQRMRRPLSRTLPFVAAAAARLWRVFSGSSWCCLWRRHHLKKRKRQEEKKTVSFERATESFIHSFIHIVLIQGISVLHCAGSGWSIFTAFATESSKGFRYCLSFILLPHTGYGICTYIGAGIGSGMMTQTTLHSFNQWGRQGQILDRPWGKYARMLYIDGIGHAWLG